MNMSRPSRHVILNVLQFCLKVPVSFFNVLYDVFFSRLLSR